MPKVHFIPDDITVEVPRGTSLLDAAEECGAKMGHACGGVCACSTCHSWVVKGLASLSEQEEREMDRLDLAFDVRPESRLGCQAEVGDEDVEVIITPESKQAYYDENPQERHELEAALKAAKAAVQHG